MPQLGLTLALRRYNKGGARFEIEHVSWVAFRDAMLDPSTVPITQMTAGKDLVTGPVSWSSNYL